MPRQDPAGKDLTMGGLKPRTSMPYSTGGTNTLRADSNNSKTPIDVGIVVALREEFRELLQDIDYETTDDTEQLRTYYLFQRPGTVTPYRIVATLVGDKGEQPAAIVTDRLVSFWAPETVVMLGIAGSLDDEDLRVGDVLVAKAVNSYMRDAKAVDATIGFEFRLGGAEFPVTPALVTRIQNLEFQYPQAYSRWRSESVAQFERLVKDETTRARLISERCVREQPCFVEGLLASGPAVSAADAFRTWLKSHRDRNLKAIDEESGGMMMAAEYRATRKNTLVLRGISDAGNVNKATIQQIGDGALRRYAMGTAVRLLWQFLEVGLLPRSMRSQGERANP